MALLFFFFSSNLWSIPDWKVCLARPISLPRTLNFSRGSSREIFVAQQKETIELLFSDTNTAAQAIWTKERSPAHSANFPIWGRSMHLCCSMYPVIIIISAMERGAQSCKFSPFPTQILLGCFVVNHLGVQLTSEPKISGVHPPYFPYWAPH